jgi:serine/threonine protein kinase
VYVTAGYTTQEAEKWTTNRVDARKADVYSYAITCAELLTGKCPYLLSEFQRRDLLSTILQGVRPHLPHEHCSVPLKDLIIRCNWPTFLQVCEELVDFKTLTIFNHQTEKK